MNFQEEFRTLKADFEELRTKHSFEDAYIDAVQRVFDEYHPHISFWIDEGGYSNTHSDDEDIVELRDKINNKEGAFIVDVWYTDNEVFNCDEILNYLDAKLIEFLQEAYSEAIASKQEEDGDYPATLGEGHPNNITLTTYPESDDSPVFTADMEDTPTTHTEADDSPVFMEDMRTLYDL